MSEPGAARPSVVWFGVDVGSVRVGVARSDASGMLAVPVATLRRDRRLGRDLDQLTGLLAEHDAVGVVVGLPRTLAGRAGPAVAEAREYGQALAARIAPRPVLYVDERLTTVLAQRNLTASGVRGRAKRSVVDQAAAVEILQSFLDGSTQQHPD
ncbi:Holliday junction resolvase RuvX [Jatrophihabitans sp.]|uniref:Holliday junction resolvase RuvX n=1 Tax=Jatrophihabitans sp. TaxID=1932789 RepID=UPI002D196D83|nr:Holliday junction resolvase RuvX [Jatrophihabitans sp.]